MKLNRSVKINGWIEERQARKEHSCDKCEREIPAGSLYYFLHIPDPSGRVTYHKKYKLHRKCAKFFIGELAMPKKPQKKCTDPEVIRRRRLRDEQEARRPRYRPKKHDRTRQLNQNTGMLDEDIFDF